MDEHTARKLSWGLLERKEYFPKDETDFFERLKDFEQPSSKSFAYPISNEKKVVEELENHPDIEVKDIKIKDPNNPAKLIEAKLITSVEK